MRGDEPPDLLRDLRGESDVRREPGDRTGTGVQPEEVEPDGLEGGDGLAEFRLDRIAHRAEVGVRRRGGRIPDVSERVLQAVIALPERLGVVLQPMQHGGQLTQFLAGRLR